MTPIRAAKAPALFISHGAPTFALEPELLGPQLKSLGQQLPALQAVLVVSPHWQSLDVRVMTTARPDTVHDFGGFPASLYRLQYPVAGHPELAQQALRLLQAAGFACQTDERRGLDHGAWVPLMHLLPQGQVPVFQVSMPFSLSTASAWQLGRTLAPLREQGVLILASGSTTHNLHDFRHHGAQPPSYVQPFADWVQAAVLARQNQHLLDYRALAPQAERAHPSEEHFLPLLVALGASSEADDVRLLRGGISNGALAMDSFVWGGPEA